MSRIEIAVDTPESEQFCAWLNAQGHDARVVNSTWNYVDGNATAKDDAARQTMNSLWDAYCNQPADIETWEAWLDGKRDAAVQFSVPRHGDIDIAEAGANALGVDVSESLNVQRV